MKQNNQTDSKNAINITSFQLNRLETNINYFPAKCLQNLDNFFRFKYNLDESKKKTLET